MNTSYICLTYLEVTELLLIFLLNEYRMDVQFCSYTIVAKIVVNLKGW
jgi:hypothetical protein